jgi:hypothetical protein
MSGSPDEEFAKIFELLNAFEQLDEEEQRAFLDPTEPPAQPPPKPVSLVPDVRAAEPEAPPPKPVTFVPDERAAEPLARPPKPATFVPDEQAAEPGAENTFAANIAAAMMKRTK